MSTEEKKLRFDYIHNRNKWIRIMIIVIASLTALSIIFGAIFSQMNKTYYINYTEVSTVDYKVYLKDNDFYEEEYLGKDQAYVASLIKEVVTDFTYELRMDTSDVEYEFTYSIDAELQVIDDKTNVVIYNPVKTIKEKHSLVQNSSNQLKVSEQVVVNYDEYNDLANKFIDTYKLTSVSSKLVLKTHISVTSICEDESEKTQNQYVVSLNIPLVKKTVKINMTSSVPEEETKIIACDRIVNTKVFLVFTIIFIVLDVLGIGFFVFFVYKTRNTHINYLNKVKKIVNNYKSYIQEISNEFNIEGYQILNIKTFTEMLEIRDTIQSPILMNENEDGTCTRFVIPTDTKLLYVFELKIEETEDEDDE